MGMLWLPEPPNESPLDEIQASDDIVIPGTDTSDTDDEMQYDGYEPLPLEPNDNADSSDEECDLQQIPQQPPTDSLPTIDPIEKVLVRDVWSGPPPQFVDIEMDSNKANEVKLAMANFSLPSSCIPEWAANVPEEQWKEQLIHRIQSLKK